MGPIYKDYCLYKEKQTHRHTQKKDGHMKTKAEIRVPATSHGTPRIVINHQILARGKEQLSESLEGA